MFTGRTETPNRISLQVDIRVVDRTLDSGAAW